MQYANIFYICVATYNAGKWQWNVLNFTLNVPLTKMIFVHMTQYSSNVPKHILALRAKRLLLHRSASNSMYLGTAHWGVYKAALWRSLSPRKCYLSDFGVMLPNTQTHFFQFFFHILRDEFLKELKITILSAWYSSFHLMMNFSHNALVGYF